MPVSGARPQVHHWATSTSTSTGIDVVPGNIGRTARKITLTLSSKTAQPRTQPRPIEPTVSATEKRRFDQPAGLLFTALEEATRLAQEAPEEQLIPSPDTVREGIALLRMLPPDVEMPEPVIEPSGALSWAWERDDGSFLVLAVNGQGQVQRSAVLDGTEAWGLAPLSERLSPDELALLTRFRVPHG